MHLVKQLTVLSCLEHSFRLPRKDPSHSWLLSFGGKLSLIPPFLEHLGRQVKRALDRTSLRIAQFSGSVQTKWLNSLVLRAICVTDKRFTYLLQQYGGRLTCTTLDVTRLSVSIRNMIRHHGQSRACRPFGHGHSDRVFCVKAIDLIQRFLSASDPEAFCRSSTLKFAMFQAGITLFTDVWNQSMLLQMLGS